MVFPMSLRPTKNTGAFNNLQCGLLNCQSVRNKTIEINSLINEHKYDIFCVTETWLSECNPAVIAEMTHKTHRFVSNPRTKKRGGGVGCFIKKSINIVNIVTNPKYLTFEYLNLSLKTVNRNLSLSLVYRPPSSNKRKFIEEFRSFINDQIIDSENLVILGDFNLWIDVETNYYANKFVNELDYVNMCNLVLEPTARGIHIIDLIIAKKESSLVSEISVEPQTDLSDHKLIQFNINIPRKRRVKSEFYCRRKRDFDPTDFIDQGLDEFNFRL